MNSISNPELGLMLLQIRLDGMLKECNPKDLSYQAEKNMLGNAKEQVRLLLDVVRSGSCGQYRQYRQFFPGTGSQYGIQGRLVQQAENLAEKHFTDLSSATAQQKTRETLEGKLAKLFPGRDSSELARHIPGDRGLISSIRSTCSQTSTGVIVDFILDGRRYVQKIDSPATMRTQFLYDTLAWQEKYMPVIVAKPVRFVETSGLASLMSVHTTEEGIVPECELSRYLKLKSRVFSEVGKKYFVPQSQMLSDPLMTDAFNLSLGYAVMGKHSKRREFEKSGLPLVYEKWSLLRLFESGRKANVIDKEAARAVNAFLTSYDDMCSLLSYPTSAGGIVLSTGDFKMQNREGFPVDSKRRAYGIRLAADTNYAAAAYPLIDYARFDAEPNMMRFYTDVCLSMREEIETRLNGSQHRSSEEERQILHSQVCILSVLNYGRLFLIDAARGNRNGFYKGRLLKLFSE